MGHWKKKENHYCCYCSCYFTINHLLGTRELHVSFIWASLVAQLVKNLPTMCEALVGFLGQEVAWRRYRLPTPVFLGFPHGSDGKESTCNVKDLGSIPGLGTSPGGGHGNPLEHSCLENPMDKGAWWLQSMGLQRVRQDWASKPTQRTLHELFYLMLLLKEEEQLKEWGNTRIPEFIDKWWNIITFMNSTIYWTCSVY